MSRRRWEILLAALLFVTACSSAPGETSTSDAPAPPGDVPSAAQGPSQAQSSDGDGEPDASVDAGGDDEGEGEPGGGFTGDACELLTTAEVEAVYHDFGTLVAEPAPTATLPVTSLASCSYLNPEAFAVAVVVSVEDGAILGGSPDELIDWLGQGAGETEEVEVGGGAQGLWIPLSFGLYVFKGDALIVLQAFVAPDGTELVDALAELAGLAADRLP